ncbi:unnamed protein product [Moneuplotes crassus]|uniref:Uncharacterized protein n=1 Tax=Euplotes crassus TaxID=5936 RepID=A0AAD1XE43_EUPCR|nr:unnamed protein product [Moneuplotes crassus]
MKAESSQELEGEYDISNLETQDSDQLFDERPSYDSKPSPRPHLESESCDKIRDMFCNYTFLPIPEEISTDKGTKKEESSKDTKNKTDASNIRGKSYTTEDYYISKTFTKSIFSRCFTIPEDLVKIVPTHTLSTFKPSPENTITPAGSYTAIGKGNSNNFNQTYFALRSPEEIFFSSLPGFIIQKIYSCGPLSEKQLFALIEPVYSTLRRLNGAAYNKDMNKAVRGSLYVQGLFLKDKHGYWHVREPACSTYILNEIQNIIKYKSKVRNKKKYHLHKGFGSESFLDHEPISQAIKQSYNFSLSTENLFEDEDESGKIVVKSPKPRPSQSPIEKLISSHKDIFEFLDEQCKSNCLELHEDEAQKFQKLKDFLEGIDCNEISSEYSKAVDNCSIQLKHLMNLYAFFRYACKSKYLFRQEGEQSGILHQSRGQVERNQQSFRKDPSKCG